jgi:hypothetical protein
MTVETNERGFRHDIAFTLLLLLLLLVHHNGWLREAGFAVYI